MRKYLAVFLLTILVATGASARPIIADLAIRSIDIDTNFRGISILLFGAREDPGDIVIVVRGEEKNYTVRKKSRVFGMWVNSQEQRFKNVSNFYKIASSKDLQKIENQPLLQALKVGIDSQDWYNINAENLQNSPENGSFNTALLMALQSKKLYTAKVEKVSFWGETLFRTNINFQSTIPEGDYLVEVYLFNDGELSAMQVTPLVVKKVGFEAFIRDFATNNSVLYGIMAVCVALFFGWIAGAVFRKV